MQRRRIAFTRTKTNQSRRATLAFVAIDEPSVRRHGPAPVSVRRTRRGCPQMRPPDYDRSNSIKRCLGRQWILEATLRRQLKGLGDVEPVMTRNRTARRVHETALGLQRGQFAQSCKNCAIGLALDLHRRPGRTRITRATCEVEEQFKSHPCAVTS